MGRLGKSWEELGRVGKTWEDLGRLGKIWEVGKIWEDMGRFDSNLQIIFFFEQMIWSKYAKPAEKNKTENLRT